MSGGNGTARGGEAAGRRVLLLFTTTGYEVEAFLLAAERLGASCVLGSDRCHVLADPWRDGAIPLNFSDPAGAARIIVEYAAIHPIQAIIGVGDRPTVTAALASRKLGLPYNPPEAVEACRNKYLARQRLQAAGLRIPPFRCVSIDSRPEEFAEEVPLPCVLKPLCLSASQGVIRADDLSGFVKAFRRITALLRTPEIRVRREDAADWILVEGFVPGREIALEALLDRGHLRPLALFDKPDPLDGPFFEETLYTTPSRLPEATQAEIVTSVTHAARALGLSHGPIHAEVRVNQAGVWVLEVAARSIGGLCSRVLRFGAGTSLEELIIRHACGMEIHPVEREALAAGVMMIPIPRRGLLRRVHGVEAAEREPGIEDVVITAKTDQPLVPLPEGSSYLGFIFARGTSPEGVEAALRRAHAHLQFEILPSVPVVR